jgi:F-type H+-transporting ATPase subunit delta
MSVAANRYAKALIEALYPDKAESGLDQLRQFSSLLQDQPDARRFFENPTIPTDRRMALLNQIADSAGTSAELRNFIGILIERNRLENLDEIIAAYERFFDKRMGVVRATVTTAQPLDATQRDELAATLAAVTGKQVRMTVAVDPELIGGAVARVGSTIYDGSLRQQLETFKARLVTE